MTNPVILSSGIVLDKTSVICDNDENQTKTKTVNEFKTFLTTSDCIFRNGSTDYDAKFNGQGGYSWKSGDGSLMFGTWKALNTRTVSVIYEGKEEHYQFNTNYTVASRIKKVFTGSW